ncbi:hypothetical protein PRN20_18045 [Devosia sp. ZB163]|uniref:hypothetical protein n=1 Tax=Devosia sp. ZB163 TaxID=3025938 RepID=UPI0023620AEE|nr:hypothetical protein [Devosia sp. ZB163]MDC9825639.1 hypothetical protein [Devosia sp. ZB163]
MTKLVLRRKGATLYAPSPDWADIMADLPEHADLNVTATKARSLSQLGTYWGLLAWVCANVEAADPWPTKDELSDWLQLEVGFVRQIAIPTEHGLIYYRVPASKSFAECPQERFTAFFDAALARLVKLCGYDPLPLYMEHMRAKGERRAA